MGPGLPGLPPSPRQRCPHPLSGSTGQGPSQKRLGNKCLEAYWCWGVWEHDGTRAGGLFSSREEPIQRSPRQHLRVAGRAQGPRLTRGCGGGGLVVLRLACLPEHAVNLQHIHPLAQLMLELCQPLLGGDLLPCKALHLMLILFLLPLQGLGTGQGDSRVSLARTTGSMALKTSRPVVLNFPNVKTISGHSTCCGDPPTIISLLFCNCNVATVISCNVNI